MTDAGISGEPRRLSGWLILGVLTIPAIFVWFVLRRGYSSDVRLGAFLHLAFTVALGIAHVVEYG